MESARMITVSAAFNGPRESGNGGYVCGLFAQELGGRAEVNLRSPVPLDTPLRLEPRGGEEPDSLALLDGEVLVADANRGEGLRLEVPAPVDPETARRATAGYRGPRDGAFSHCFVC